MGAMDSEILTPAEMYRADALCDIPESTLIENAGRVVAEEILRRYGARKTVVLCGPGNNGRDGAVAARILRQWGWPVEISPDISGAELIIDALYGAGLNRDFPQDLADTINAAQVPVVSIDIPSGLDGLTGRPRGACLKACLTITFFRKKPAHVLMPGREVCGEIVLADIGIPSSVLAEIEPKLCENTKPLLPSLQPTMHKYNRGHALVMSGPALHTGASRLAATAALRAGAGLVTIGGGEAALSVHAAHTTAVMLAKIESALGLEKYLDDRRFTALCIGPAAGIGSPTRALVRAGLGCDLPVVIDADALTSFSQNPDELVALIRENPARAVVMTPHEGEFARLFRNLAPSFGAKHERALKAAKMSGAIIILKGADTVIASPEGHATINTNAPPSLATAGSGDVLAGLVTGLLAQGIEPYKAARAAVWLHGDAANRHGPQGLTAESLLENNA